MNVRGIRVTAVVGERAGQSGYVSTWPMPEWGINVGWDDGTITTARHGEIIVPDEAAQLARHAAIETRLCQLGRMSKRDLLATMTGLARQHGASWAIGGPALWSKDELINGILDFEFQPQVTS